MLAVARERHPRQSVGRIWLLSSPFRPGGGGEGLGERGGMNKALKRLQSHPARLLNDFYAASPCPTCARSYQKCSNSCAATPTLTPNPFLAPPGEKGGPTALCGRVLEVDEFTVNRQLSKPPSTAGWGRVCKVWRSQCDANLQSERGQRQCDPRLTRFPASLNVGICA